MNEQLEQQENPLNPEQTQAVESLVQFASDSYFVDKNIAGLKEMVENGQEVLSIIPGIVAKKISQSADEQKVNDLQIVVTAAVLFAQELLDTFIEMGYIEDMSDMPEDQQGRIHMGVIKSVLEHYAKAGSEKAEQMLQELVGAMNQMGQQEAPPTSAIDMAGGQPNG